MIDQILSPSGIISWEIHVLNERPPPSRSAPCRTSSQDGAWLLSGKWALDHLTDTPYKNVLINVSQPHFSAKRPANLKLSYIDVRRFSQSREDSETWTIEHPSTADSWSPGGWGTENISRKTLEWRESMLRCTRNWVCSACITTLPSSNQIFERVMRSGSMVVGSIWLYYTLSVNEFETESRSNTVLFHSSWRQNDRPCQIVLPSNRSDFEVNSIRFENHTTSRQFEVSKWVEVDSWWPSKITRNGKFRHVRREY